MKLRISAICNQFSAKCYDEFNLVFVSFSPSSICVPVYSGKYLSSSNDKYFFPTLYMAYKQNVNNMKVCGKKPVIVKRLKF